MYAYLPTAAVARKFESTDVTVSEGAGLVNLTIVTDGETTVDSTVVFSTVQSGSAMGKLLSVMFVVSIVATMVLTLFFFQWTIPSKRKT